MKAASALQVELQVGGISLQEYAGNAEDSTENFGRTYNRYVQAVSGSKFTVRITVPLKLPAPANESVCCRVFLDGTYATGCVVERYMFTGTPWVYLIDGVNTMTTRGRELQRFTFTQLKTHDGPITTAIKPEQLKELGTVSVQFTWCRRTSANFTQIRDSFESKFDTELSEKFLKGRAISNQASVAKAESMPGTYEKVPLDYPYGTKPFATFNFNYRSRKDLQIEGIIEQDPEPTPLEDRDPATLTTEEVGQLQKKLQDQLADMVKVKTEKRAWVPDEDDHDEDEALVLISGSSHKKRKPTDAGEETIDLTDD